jgi:hypothetical protein
MIFKNLMMSSLFLLVTIQANSIGQSSFHCGARFERELEQPASIHWAGVPLREGLTSLSTTRQIAFWLDRRVDPSQRLFFTAREDSLHDCFGKLSSDVGLGVSWFDCIVYIGPDSAADRCATVIAIHREQLTKLSPPMRDRWQRPRALAWEALTTPQDLVRGIGKEVGVDIQGVDQVPHDLWGARQLPPLSPHTRLGLVLSGFGLTFVFNRDGSAKVVQMPSRPRFRKAYRIPSDRQADFDDLVANRRDIEIHKGSDQTELVASWTVHEQVTRALHPAARQANGETRYTLRGKNQPLGPLIEQLCRQLEMSCQFSDNARREYDRRVSFEVAQVDRDALFEAILLQAQLSGEIQADHLSVHTIDERP